MVRMRVLYYKHSKKTLNKVTIFYMLYFLLIEPLMTITTDDMLTTEIYQVFVWLM